jgi:8-oxo-dGTP diphosphatase
MQGKPSADPAAFLIEVVVAILAVADGEGLSVVLVGTGTRYELPSGWRHPYETLDEAARRVFEDATGTEAAGRILQLRTYGEQPTSPEAEVVSVAYRIAVPFWEVDVADPTMSSPYAWPVEQVDIAGLKLPPRHRRILQDALDRTRLEVESTDLALAFVEPNFTLGDLRGVFEAVWDIELDPANFRRSVLSPDAPYIEPTGRTVTAGSIDSGHPMRGRPPELYRARLEAWLDGAPVRRPRSPAKREANKRLFAQIRQYREAGRLRDALELCPEHWTTERAAILAQMSRRTVRG